MKMKLLIASLIFLSITSFAQSKATEDKILDTIFRLKEVKERADYVKKASQGKRHLGVVIYTKPSNEAPYYWVKACEDNGISYYTHFNFYVYPKPFAIKFIDTERDIVISLDEWREQAKHKNSR
jgi:hypothetical protein